MSGPKLIALILFSLLTFAFGWLLSAGLVGGSGAVLSALTVTALTGVFIHYAKTTKQAFARGFLALGATFILVPFATLFVLGDRVARNLPAITNGEEVIQNQLFFEAFIASAGLIFGTLIGLILIAVGGLMHLKPKPAAPPKPPQGN